MRFDGTLSINSDNDRQFKFIIISGKSSITDTTGFESIANSIPSILSNKDNWYTASESINDDGVLFTDADGNLSIIASPIKKY